MTERPGVLRLGDRVVFAGAEHAVVALTGSSVRLVAGSGEATVVAVPYLVGAPDFAVVGAGPRARVSPEGLLESLPARVAEAPREWERHLAEAETGLPMDAPPGSGPRPGYDPALTSLADRERAKAAELTAAGTMTSPPTVQRMRQRYREQGLWSLVDARYARRLALLPGGQLGLLAA